ncbi:hypothetical protein F5Y19DRAFT_407766 [Xylariaceae sp. FL1651]|nr:hypothetical protein F5Y19DRAFT_407766 [Xylariaceae sp. FL1651]
MAALLTEVLYAFVWLIEICVFALWTAFLVLSLFTKLARFHAGNAQRYGEHCKDRRSWLLLALSALLWLVALSGIVSSWVLECAPDGE